MKKYFNYLSLDRLVLRLYIITFILIIATIAYTLFNYGKLPPLLPIFNQLPWGEERLSGGSGIFIPGAAASLIFLFNIFLSALIYTRSPLISRILAITSFLTALLSFLFTLRTIALII